MASDSEDSLSLSCESSDFEFGDFLSGPEDGQEPEEAPQVVFGAEPYMFEPEIDSSSDEGGMSDASDSESENQATNVLADRLQNTSW